MTDALPANLNLAAAGGRVTHGLTLRLTLVSWLAAAFVLACGSDEAGSPGTGPGEATGQGDASADGSVGELSNADGSTDNAAIQSGTLIELGDGRVQGDTDDGARRFRGIPFASPPVGELRWKPPEPVEPWEGVLEATEFAPPCAQSSWIQGPESLVEDCLYLNVWTPDPAPASPLPVMVWLPGGGNQNGSAGDTSPLSGGEVIYDGQDLAASHDVVVVTINYRVGVMGFFSHPGLGAEGSVSGNQGLLDQQAALRWVRDNIVAFGGDPNNVTLFGESAGSQDTCLQVVSPGADGLFHRAISQSGGCMTFRKTQAEAESQVEAFVQEVGCADATDELACLREKPVDDLLIEAPVDGGDPDAPGGGRFGGGTERWDFNPVVDGEVIPDQPRELVNRGEFAKVPYLLGSNFEEGRLFLLAATPVTTESEYVAALERLFGDDASRVLEVYPPSDFATPQDALVRIWGDYRLGCSTTETAQLVSEQGTTTYLYDFRRPIPGLEALEATHGVEMPYLFGTLPADPPAEDVALSNTLQGYWTRFAETGDPNGGDALEWPVFDEQSNQRMSFDLEPEVITDFRREECALWSSIYAADFR